MNSPTDAEAVQVDPVTLMMKMHGNKRIKTKIELYGVLLISSFAFIFDLRR